MIRSKNDFQKDDRVKCIKTDGSDGNVVGRIGTIVAVTGNTYRVEYDDNDYPQPINGMFEDRYELIPEPRFNAGDRVIYTGKHKTWQDDSRVGQKGIVIIDGNTRASNVRVLFDNKKVCGVFPENIENIEHYIEPVTSVETPIFNVGDRVEYIGNTLGFTQRDGYKGVTGIITSLTANSLATIEPDSFSTCTNPYLYNLKVLPPVFKPKFKVGDKVRYIDNGKDSTNSSKIGLVGIVTSDHKQGETCVNVKFPTKFSYPCGSYVDNLVLVDETTSDYNDKLELIIANTEQLLADLKKMRTNV